MPIDKEVQKEALKEALKEWLTEQAARFGWFSLKFIGLSLFAAGVYSWLFFHGWSAPR